MRRFFHDDDFSGLESELRDGRPEPRRELLNELVARVERVPARAPVARRPRAVAALVFALVVLLALSAFGGIGYAKSSLLSAAKSSGNVVSAVAGGGGQKATVKTSTARSGEDAKSGGSQGVRSSREDDDDDDDDPPWEHQYSRFVVVCYPFTIGPRTFSRTIVVPRRFVTYFVPPGTLGPCRVFR